MTWRDRPSLHDRISESLSAAIARMESLVIDDHSFGKRKAILTVEDQLLIEGALKSARAIIDAQR